MQQPGELRGIHYNKASFIFYFLCALLGVWPLVVYGPQVFIEIWVSGVRPTTFRLTLVLFILSLEASLLLFSLREWFTPSPRFSLIPFLLRYPKRLIIALFVFVSCLAIAWLFIFSPIRMDFFYIYYRRWQPIFLWGIFSVGILYAILFFARGHTYWFGTGRELLRDRIWYKAFLALNSPGMGIVLLVLSFLVGVTKVYFGRFVDEGENLAIGWLISEGNVLYRDVFSHHFPLAYYWVSVVVSIFGNSLAVTRGSIVLLQMFLFAIIMSRTGLYFQIGLVALVWNLINQFQRANQIIYHVFSALFIFFVFILVFSNIMQRDKMKKVDWFIVGIFMALALLSDPLMAYPVGIAILGLFISMQTGVSLNRIFKSSGKLFITLAAIAIVIGLYTAYLVLTGTVKDFYRDAIQFNLVTYEKFLSGNPNRINLLLFQAVSGFDAFNPEWRKELSPFIQLNVAESRLEDEGAYLSWLFSNFLFRISILSCVLGLLLHRKLYAAGFLYLFAASLMARESSGFYIMGFNLVSVFAGIYLTTKLSKPVLLELPVKGASDARKIGGLPVIYIWKIWILLIATMWTWSAIRGAYFILTNWEAITEPEYLPVYDRFEEHIRQLTCFQPGLELSYFPNDPIIHFFTRIPPASRYVLMFPWMADAGAQELITELRANPSAVVRINTRRVVARQYLVSEYMSEVISFLNQEYVAISDNLWISPELTSGCHPLQVQPLEAPDD